MTNLPAFTFASNLFEIGVSTSGGAIAVGALANSRIVFHSNLPANQFITFQGDEYWPPASVTADVNDVGAIVKDGFPVKLLANDSDLSVTGIQWTVEVLIPEPSGTQRIGPITFAAPNDGDTVGFSTITPSTPTPPGGGTPLMSIDGGEL